jgi:hypothetical protein
VLRLTGRRPAVPVDHARAQPRYSAGARVDQAIVARLFAWAEQELNGAHRGPCIGAPGDAHTR